MLYFEVTPGSEFIKRFFMLNSAEREICPANKYQVTNTCKCYFLNIAEGETFSSN